MSINSMVEAKMTRENAAAREPGYQPAGVGSGIAELTRWIPTESLLLYVSLLTAVNPVKPPRDQTNAPIWEYDYAGRWIALIVFVVVTLGLVLITSYGRSRSQGVAFRWPLFESIAAPVAFAAWAIALPDTPLLDIEGFNHAIGGFVLLAATVMIAVTANAFGKSPKIEKVTNHD